MSNGKKSLPSANSLRLTQVMEWNDGQARRFEDAVAREEPLEIIAGRRSLGITMRTPGHDDELAAGLLLTQGIIDRIDQIIRIAPPLDGRASGRGNRVRVTVRGTKQGFRGVTQKSFASSACGVCGRAFIQVVSAQRQLRPNGAVKFAPEMLCRMPDLLRSAQAVFGQTGGLHAAGLFNVDGEMLVLREDIGRHNSVDKVVGWALLNHRVPLDRCALMVSGRGGFEIIQKAVATGIPLVASVSAPSSLAVQLAREMRLTLIGFLRGRRFVIYSGDERVAM
jgi:FdhD protein